MYIPPLRVSLGRRRISRCAKQIRALQVFQPVRIYQKRSRKHRETICTARGCRWGILNPSRIYGPGFDTGSNPVTKIVELYVKGKWKVIPGSGNDIGSYPYIDDVVDGHIAAMERGRSGERYIFGGVNVTFNDLIAAIKKYSGLEKKLRHIPFPILRIVSQLMLLNAKLPAITR